MKITINTDNENYGLPRFLIKYIERFGLRDNSNECVFNIDSVSGKGFKKGTKCTIYLEGDEFQNGGYRKEMYDAADILYILHPCYLNRYPPKTRILKMGVDPEWHYPRNVPKIYDYVFVGRCGGNSVYENRKDVLQMYKDTKYKVLVTEGTQENYCDLLSSGRIILNILPRIVYQVNINLRVFEAMAIGCLMCDYDKIMDDFGIIKNVHFLPLDRFGDVSDEEIKKIHESGSKFALDNYSTVEAVKTIVRDIEEFLNT